MKTLSQKQFDNAVKRVLNGGKSSMIITREEKPLSWSISGGYNNLKGSIPTNSKFLRNDAKGGKASDVYLVCYLAPGYSISATKAETAKIQKVSDEKKSLATEKRNKQAEEFKKLAKQLGFSSVSKLKSAQKEIELYNSERLSRALAKRESDFIKINGSFEAYKISDRVKISKIELVFDCEKKENLY